MTADRRVRRARADDAQAIGAVHVDVWRWAYRGQMPDAFLDGLRPDRRAAQWRRWLTDGELDAWVAEVDGAVVGFAGSGDARDDDLPAGTVELLMINVAQEHAGTGVGGALLAAIDEHWRALGATEAVLWVLPGNARAMATYTHLGWSLDGSSRVRDIGGAPVEEVRMRRRID